MKITRQNYEHWFIDFIEGNLNPNDEALVREFVQINPDLNNELEDLLSCKMVPIQTKFQNKDLLKQNPLKAIRGITKFEQLSIAHLENELDKNEQVDLDRLLINSDKKKEEFQIIQRTKLLADNDVIFPSKNDLKKLFIVKSKIKNYKIIYRVAAVFILLMGLTLFLYQNSRINITGKQLTKIKIYPKLRKVVQNKETNIITIKDNLTISTSLDQVEKQENKQIAQIPEELVAFKCNSIQDEGINFNLDRLETGIYDNAYALNNKAKKREVSLDKKIKYTLIYTGKSLATRVSKAFKKTFHYEKSYTDNGRMLIAFNIGDYQYQIDKKQRK
ncbi:MAG: hypothetical protein DRI95_14085 [Bacteroidetes bacterium]|nr:MAG: hypothetical protein DRI95_14085 [Bacteroidota bacterium]